MNVSEEVKERLSIFKNLYDVIRIIDPVRKKSIISKNSNIKRIENDCYSFWENNDSCENCISNKAYTEQDTFTKIEYNKGKMYFIIATPVKFEGKDYILEMIKEVDMEDLHIDTNGELKDIISDLNKKTITDELTGVYNRRYISERLPIDINKSLDMKRPLSVAIADIDYFKSINDSYGHVIGDWVLKDICKIMKSCLVEDDHYIGKYGGDEFFIVLNDCNVENAVKIAENIRKNVERHKFKHENKDINITLSLGISTLSSFITLNDLIMDLDKKLYKAKNSGRNKIII